MRQRLTKKREPQWSEMVRAAHRAIQELRYAHEIMGVHARQLEGWNREHEGSCGHIGDANLRLTREYIISAVDHLRLAIKGVVK